MHELNKNIARNFTFTSKINVPKAHQSTALPCPLFSNISIGQILNYFKNKYVIINYQGQGILECHKMSLYLPQDQQKLFLLLLAQNQLIEYVRQHPIY